MYVARRSILQTGLAALASAPFAGRAAPARSLKILVLGGTYFLGPAVVEAALARGHEVSLFNRGKTNPDLFPKLEKIRGDRDVENRDLSGLGDTRKWDAVIDVWPSNPHMPAATAKLLADRTDRYIYISTVVSYKDLTKPGVVETDPLYDDLTNAASWYEFDKAQSERALYSILGDKATTLRPPILSGYRQDSDTLRFWLVRLARGGRVISPGDGSDPVEFTSIRDVGAFAVHAAENNLSGPYNVIGPSGKRMTFREMLKGFNAALGNKAELVWIDNDFLAKNGVRFWTNLPAYMPLDRVKNKGFMQVSNTKAVAAGMTFQSLGTIAADEMRWFKETMPADYDFGTDKSNKGFTRVHELEILKAWDSRSKA